MVEYFSWILQGKSHVQVDSCCIVFEYSLKHTQRDLIGTRVFAQNLPASTFRANKFACTRRAKRE